MDLSVLFKRAGKVAADNSPAILTAIGVTGTLATAYLAAKGAFQAADVITKAQAEEDKNDESHPLTNEEKFHLTWKLYIPAASCAVLSVTAIICANRISDRRAAAFASAYSVIEKAYGEHRTKTVAKVGKKKEQEIRDEIAQDRLNAHPPNHSTIYVTGEGDTWCYDMWTDRYFMSNKETIRTAVNDFNQRLINETYLSLSEFYHLLDIPATKGSELVGWNTSKLLEVEYSGTLRDDGTPCVAFDFRTNPEPYFSELH